MRMLINVKYIAFFGVVMIGNFIFSITADILADSAGRALGYSRYLKDLSDPCFKTLYDWHKS